MSWTFDKSQRTKYYFWTSKSCGNFTQKTKGKERCPCTNLDQWKMMVILDLCRDRCFTNTVTQISISHPYFTLSNVVECNTKAFSQHSYGRLYNKTSWFKKGKVAQNK